MPTPTTDDTRITRHDIKRCILIAGLLTAAADGVFGIGQYIIADIPSPVPRFFQGIAAVALGKRPLHGGPPAFALGVVMHLAVAFFWTALFALLLVRSHGMREMLASRGGAFKMAVVYGPVIWSVMSFLVISSLVHHLPAIDSGWWIEFVGHVFSAGLPIALVFRIGLSSARATV